MRAFDHPNMTNFMCPICRTKADKPVVLVGIHGTEDEGNMQAEQVHLECYELVERMSKSESKATGSAA